RLLRSWRAPSVLAAAATMIVAAAAPGWAAATTTRASVNSSGVQGNHGSGAVYTAGSGRFVAFESDATNLVGGDTNSVSDIFLRDRLNGNTYRVSVGRS